MKSESNRIRLLTRNEQNTMYGIPDFTNQDRAFYFHLESDELEIVQRLQGIKSKAHFIIMLGYYKAKRVFISFEFKNIQADVQYISERYFSDKAKPRGPIASHIRHQHQILVLRVMGHSKMNSATKEQLLSELATFSKQSLDARQMMLYCLEFFRDKAIVLPSYHAFQVIISSVIVDAEKSLFSLFDQYCSKELLIKLKEIVISDENSLFSSSALKGNPKQYYKKDLQDQLEKLKKLVSVYRDIASLLDMMELSAQQVDHFHNEHRKKSGYEFHRMKKRIKYLNLSCFLYTCFRRINNYLIKAWVYHVNQIEQDGRDYANNKYQEYQIEANEHFADAAKLLLFYTNKEMPNQLSFEEVRASAFDILSADKIDSIANFMQNQLPNKKRFFWHYQESGHSDSFKPLLRSVLKEINIDLVKGDPIFDQLELIRASYGDGPPDWHALNNKLDLSVIPDVTRPHIEGDHANIAKRVEFWLWMRLADSIDTYKVSFPDSTEFRRYQDDLVSEAKWINKDKLIKDLGITRIGVPIKDILKEYREENRALFKKINDNIRSNKNPYVEVEEDGERLSWSVAVPKLEPFKEHQFYSQLPRISIIDVIHMVDNDTGFFKELSSVQQRYRKSGVLSMQIIACLLASGTQLGLRRMSDSAADNPSLSLDRLKTIFKNHFRPLTIKKATECLVNATKALPVFKHFQMERELLHASCDGQRFQTLYETPKSQHCKKYFGQGKGVVAYTLVGWLPLISRIIDRDGESNYVVDLLLKNGSDINPDRISTDNHGINNVNYALLDLLGYYFAPRYAKLNRKLANLYSIDPVKQFSECIIKPTHRINTDRLIDEWDNIQRIIVSLSLGYCDQKTLVKKFNKSKRGDPTMQALWDLNHIIRTNYILNYIDDASLRRFVTRSLNRGEHYHSLRRMLSNLHGSKFRSRNDLEIELANDCSVLLSNCIIYYNTVLLNQLWLSGGPDQRRIIESISPIGWQHLQMTGSYDFSGITAQTSLRDFVKGLNLAEVIGPQ